MFTKTQTNTPGNPSVDTGKIRTMQDDLSGGRKSSTSTSDPMVNPASAQNNGSIAFDQLSNASQQSQSGAPGEYAGVKQVPLTQQSAQVPPSTSSGNTATSPIQFTQSVLDNKPVVPNMSPAFADVERAASGTEGMATPPVSRKSPVLYAFFSVLMVLLFGFGAYYYWTTRMQSPSSPDLIGDDPVTGDTDDIPQIPPTPANTFSFQPNQLNIYLVDETDSLAIRDLIQQAKTQMKESAVGAWAEIRLQKTNNGTGPINASELKNALAFSLSPEMDKVTTTNIRYFLYRDVEGVRAGVAMSVPDESVVGLMKNAENLLPNNLLGLYLDPITPPVAGSFRDGKVGDVSTRFFNLGTTPAYSVDYALKNSMLIIGTSQKTLEMLLGTVQ